MFSTGIVARVAVCAAIVFIGSACGGDNAAPPRDTAPTSASANAGPATPAAGGKYVEVEMVTDGDGSYFKPSEVHANRGDVIRFKLKVGVHNTHFPADSNAGKSGMPSGPGEFLQLPGQTYDVAVGMEPGSYFFQCDPHVALGMKGRLIVH
jgi:plastocyanin